MFCYVYVLKSKLDNHVYIGYTEDLKRRYQEHQKGSVIATRQRRPFDLVYFEGHKDKNITRAPERYLKTGWGRRYLRTILK